MKKTILLGFIGLFCFAACDKIEPDQYTVATSGGSGNGGRWSNGGTQCALVEKFTGPRCVNCPNADVTLDSLHVQYGEQLVVISINHPTGQGEPFPNQPDMRTEAGTAWDQYFGIGAIPAAYLNRNKAKQYSGSMDNLGSDIGALIHQDPSIELTINADGDTATRQIDITVSYHIYDRLEGDITLTLALTEDSLSYRQLHPSRGIVNDYIHNHMLRDVITDTWGDDIPTDGVAGESKVKNFTYTVTNPDIKLQNCHVVGFISYKNDRSVLNCNQAPVVINQ